MGWTADSFKGKVDGEVQDMTRAIHGDHWLEGEIPGDGDKPDTFRVRINLRACGLGGETISSS